DGSVLIQAIWALIYLSSGCLLLLRPRSTYSLIKRHRILVLLLLMAAASTTWCIAPEVTLRRSVALVGMTLFGVLLAQRFTPDQLLQLLAWSLGLAALGSYMTIVLLPSYGIMEGVHLGAWRGLYLHKNHLGRYMALGALVFMLLPR